MAALPLELQLLVIELALPPPGYGAARRAELLSKFALVCRDWRTPAQSHLARHVSLATGTQAHQFLHQLKARSALGPLVRSLRLGQLSSPDDLRRPVEAAFVDAEADFALSDILSACSGLQELRISSLVNVELATVAKSESLRKVFLWATDLVLANPDGLRFPNLRHLYLTDTTFHGLQTAAVLHERARLPRLTALGEAFGTILIPAPLAPGPQASDDDPLEPQLLALSCAVPLATAKIANSSIVLLDCWTEELTPVGIRHLPPSLRILRLNAFPEHGPSAQAASLLAFASTLAAHLRRDQRTSKLEEILVPTVPGAAYATAVKQLADICAQSKVVVTREDRDDNGESCFFDDGFWDAVDRIEGVLDNERRAGRDS